MYIMVRLHECNCYLDLLFQMALFLGEHLITQRALPGN